MRRILQKTWQNPRHRHEAGWVVLHKVAEFALTFITLKLFTRLMGKEIYGQYNLVLSGALLLGNLAIMPMQQAFLRYHHTAVSQDVVGAAGRLAIRWMVIVTAAALLAAAIVSAPLSGYLGLETWAMAAGGLLFFGNRWRVFILDLLNMRRLRRASAVHGLSYQALQILLVCLALTLWPVSTTLALLATGLAALLFGIVGAVPFIRDVLQRSSESRSDMGAMIVNFGLPTGVLMTCRWVQNFAERYILGIRLDFESVGLYVAAYQVCGIPFMLGQAIFRGLLLPLAYQRATDVNDARQLWSADRIVLAGIALYVGAGLLILPVYFFFGPMLLKLLTSADFVLPAQTLLCLALARYLQCLAPLIEMIFGVHQRMLTSLSFRVIGGLIVIPLCWFAIEWYGLTGAAVGILVAGLVYVLVLCFAPGGCVHLLWSARRNARNAGPPGPAAIVEEKES